MEIKNIIIVDPDRINAKSLINMIRPYFEKANIDIATNLIELNIKLGICRYDIAFVNNACGKDIKDVVRNCVYPAFYSEEAHVQDFLENYV